MAQRPIEPIEPHRLILTQLITALLLAVLTLCPHQVAPCIRHRLRHMRTHDVLPVHPHIQGKQKQRLPVAVRHREMVHQHHRLQVYDVGGRIQQRRLPSGFLHPESFSRDHITTVYQGIGLYRLPTQRTDDRRLPTVLSDHPAHRLRRHLHLMKHPIGLQCGMLEHFHILLKGLVLHHSLRETEQQDQCHHEYGGHEPCHPQTQPCGEGTAQVSEKIHLQPLAIL